MLTAQQLSRVRLALPLLAGVFDFCVFAPLFGAPLSGPQIRAVK